MSEDDLLLTEIDENLRRAELTPMERSQHLGKRKEIFERKHPETKAGTAGAKARWNDLPKNDANDNLSVAFAADTVAATGVDARTIQRDIRRFEKIDPAVQDFIMGTEIAKSGVELDALAKMKPTAQMAAVVAVKEKKVESALMMTVLSVRQRPRPSGIMAG